MWWTESRPKQAGRNALVCDGVDVWSDVSVRTRVHSYGGGAWWPDGVDGVYACDDSDGRLWHLPADKQPYTVTPSGAFEYAWRYADGRAQQMQLVCVREDHHANGEEVNQIVRLADSGSELEVSELEVLASGADFYASPRLSPDGQHLAWIQWNHPNMPWDQTELWVDNKCVISGQGSVVEPQWGADGSLYVVSDHKGWWNLYRVTDDTLWPVLEMDAETHRPAWVFDDPSYAVCDDNTVVAVAMRGSLAELWVVPPNGAKPAMLDLPWTSYSSVRAAGNHTVCAIAASPTQAPTVVRVDVADGSYEEIRASVPTPVATSYLSVPEAISFATTNGTEAHALYYRPTNPVAKGHTDELPPLLVLSHGGPTGAARSGLQLGIQYWTSRGIAVVDVNYRGSTGYGTVYRKMLEGQWGISDVDDCVAAALHLVRSGQADGDRLVIKGASAGGYTTLCALAFHKVFAAGASRYGIANLAALAVDTHKFEARYMDRLVGPYPEASEVYEARSPLYFVDDFEAPMIILQGADDPVVPPNQAEMIVDALKKRSIPVSYLLFAGEQHGFRKAENIVAALEAELTFFADILGFSLNDNMV